MSVAETAEVYGAAECQPQNAGAGLLPFSYLRGHPWGRPGAGAQQEKLGSPQHSTAKDPKLMRSLHHQLSSTPQTPENSGCRARAVLPLDSRFTSSKGSHKKTKNNNQESHLMIKTQKIQKSSKLHFQLKSGKFFCQIPKQKDQWKNYLSFKVSVGNWKKIW